MNVELIGALTELEKERGISKEILLDAIETAIVSAYKRNYGANSATSVRVELNEQTGEILVYSRKIAVDEVQDDTAEILVAEAREIDPNYEIGDIVEREVTPRDFGRIAAQTAKQVVIQKIREAERSVVYDEYANRTGDVVTGIVQRYEHRNVMVDLGNVEGVLTSTEQIPREQYPHHTRLKFYISDVRQSSKGPQIFLSRTHPGLLRNLFELEVPELQSGEVEIKSVAREAGNRSKIAVYSRDPDVDPVGACVGSRGTRVQNVVSELNNEKIDIVEWVDDPEEFIKNALSPAKVFYVRIDDENKIAYTIVPNDQLSLAIGKEGQNARLAARLTGWRIDIKSIDQADELFASLDAQLEDETETDGEELTELDQQVDDVAGEEADVENEEAEEPAVEKPVPAEKSTAKKKEIKAEPDSKPLSETDLANLTNVMKRKSWSERFGNASQTEEEQVTNEDSTSDKQDSDTLKRKKKERVITDLSELDLSDFGFGDKK